jgi:hypothetical protein
LALLRGQHGRCSLIYYNVNWSYFLVLFKSDLHVQLTSVSEAGLLSIKVPQQSMTKIIVITLMILVYIAVLLKSELNVQQSGLCK